MYVVRAFHALFLFARSVKQHIHAKIEENQQKRGVRISSNIRPLSSKRSVA